MCKWLSVVGIGEDGLSSLTPIALSLVNQAEVLVGGERHLGILPVNDVRSKIPWGSPIRETVAKIMNLRGTSVCVLASGDPMCYGIGVTLRRSIPIEEMTIVPTSGAFSLACARLGWSFTEVNTLSLCGRPVELLSVHLYHDAKLLILSADKRTPSQVAAFLQTSGYGKSKLTILEHMGGNQERIIAGIASSWQNQKIADLNTIAVECIADSGVVSLSRLSGLPDDAYHHDGQLTKKEIRAITLAALAPLPGQLLWDIGAGCGSIGIEWMRSHPRCQALAIEKHPSRLKYIADNAASLGTPYLNIISGKAPEILDNLPTPDVIFIGGGVTNEGLLETCWQTLPTSGRLVTNVVTVEGEMKIFDWYKKFGGNLTRVAIQRAETIGNFWGWKAMVPITQWVVVKS
ncbi:MAG: bifunctional cobalt-precorrin-7 (C(5))-methyltransferase/cobalt-precorrin-6B (C(15))-methyltransferase [Richelia sp.]|nr:bifunctional cobalt-precorrin-7 (C(5))-methyltransferase/cobalt-precorrin-6B (C(15))-methyltransferase [Richelia sp.]CDN15126.1 Cobalt-precorrin-6y C5-methyltransferase / Cobalt-precorrin-6y C15-methyltransferase [decarboxylating] [Richelia intracellularis]